MVNIKPVQRKFHVYDRTLDERTVVNNLEAVSKLTGIPLNELPKGRMYMCTVGETTITELSNWGGGERHDV